MPLTVEFSDVRFAYGASKGALLTAARYLALELGRDAIRVNTVALAFWEESDHPEAQHVRESILQALNLGDKSADLRAILEKAGADRWIDSAFHHGRVHGVIGGRPAGIAGAGADSTHHGRSRRERAHPDRQSGDAPRADHGP